MNDAQDNSDQNCDSSIATPSEMWCIDALRFEMRRAWTRQSEKRPRCSKIRCKSGILFRQVFCGSPCSVDFMILRHGDLPPCCRLPTILARLWDGHQLGR